MKYLECVILRINDGVTLISVDERISIKFTIQNAIIEPEARINPERSMPVIFKGDIEDTIPYVTILGRKCPIRVERPVAMEYCGIFQIELEFDDTEDCYVEINRGVI